MHLIVAGLCCFGLVVMAASLVLVLGVWWVTSFVGLLGLGSWFWGWVVRVRLGLVLILWVLGWVWLCGLGVVVDLGFGFSWFGSLLVGVVLGRRLRLLLFWAGVVVFLVDSMTGRFGFWLVCGTCVCRAISSSVRFVLCFRLLVGFAFGVGALVYVLVGLDWLRCLVWVVDVWVGFWFVGWLSTIG